MQMLEYLMPMLNKPGKPVHLLGIADEESIRRSVHFGIDTYDSCFPTRLARHGTILTKAEGRLHIKGKKHSKSYGTRKAANDSGLSLAQLPGNLRNVGFVGIIVRIGEVRERSDREA